MAGRFGLVTTIPDYPGFVRTSSLSNGGGDEVWQGVIRPYAACTERDLMLVLDDLQAASGVCIRSGTLSHDPNCRREHAAIPLVQAMYLLKRMDGFDAEAFTIRVVVPPAPRHPKAIALYPEISAESHPKHPHLFRQDRRPGSLSCGSPDALCTYRPGSEDGDLATSSMTTYLDYVALFLAKHVVWGRTRGPEGVGLWLGPDASHLPGVLSMTIRPDEECHCGNGRAYGECHRGADLVAARQTGPRPAV
jgi:hypothetical protein